MFSSNQGQNQRKVVTQMSKNAEMDDSLSLSLFANVFGVHLFLWYWIGQS